MLVPPMASVCKRANYLEGGQMQNNLVLAAPAQKKSEATGKTAQECADASKLAWRLWLGDVGDSGGSELS